MPVVPEPERLDTLRRLGLSDPLVRLSAGEELHPVFAFRCQGPPGRAYHGAGVPDGPPLAPLWDCGDTVTGVWEQGGRPEFIGFSVEAPDEYWVLAATEQGLWATVFADLFEDRDDLAPEDFDGAARLVGFRFIGRVVYRDEAAVSTCEGREAWLRGVVAGIDRDAAIYGRAGREPEAGR